MEHQEIAMKIRSVIDVFGHVKIDSTMNNVKFMSAGLMYLNNLAEQLENTEKDEVRHEPD